jgi:hypothetical protein
MILDIWKTFKNMCGEYEFEDWVYLFAVLAIISYALYGCAGVLGIIENPGSMGMMDAR